MNPSKLTALSLLTAFIIPTGSFAANSAVQAYDEIRGPFATQEEAEAACMEAVGFDEDSIRVFSGNMGHLWEAGNPLRFLVRRCLNNIKKAEANRLFGQRKEERKQARIDKYIAPKSLEKIRESQKNTRDRTYDNVRLRASQQIRSASENLQVYANIRSARRQETRASERAIRNKLDRKEEFKKEAEAACSGVRGAQRTMCIRKEVREREEELYEEN